MSWRLPARLLTGPAGFLLAGVIDLTAFAWSEFAARVRGQRP